MSLEILPSGRKHVKDDSGLLFVTLDHKLVIRSLSQKLASMLAHPIGHRGIGDPLSLWCRGSGPREALAMSQAIIGTQEGQVELTLQLVAGEYVKTTWLVRHDGEEIRLGCISHRAGENWGIIGWLSDLRATGLTQTEAIAQAQDDELPVPLLELI